MKFGRIFRDLLILALVAGVFYLVVQAASVFRRTEPTKSSFYSEARRMADQLFNDKKYREAIPYLDQLIEEDPFNSYALNRKAACSAAVFQTLVRSNPDAREVEGFATESLRAFEALLDYPRYANTARFRMAVIYAIQNEDEKALEVLTAAVNDGFYSRRGLESYQPFEKFLNDGRFREIARQERWNQEDYRRRRQGSVRVRGGG